MRIDNDEKECPLDLIGFAIAEQTDDVKSHPGPSRLPFQIYSMYILLWYSIRKLETENYYYYHCFYNAFYNVFIITIIFDSQVSLWESFYKQNYSLPPKMLNLKL